MPVLHGAAHGEFFRNSLSLSSVRYDTKPGSQMQFCNVIIYSYHYLLDPKIAERVSRELSRDCIVVFDEAHNIDNVCIESLSTDLTEDSLRKATRGAHNLERKVAELKDTDQEKLRGEYDKLVEGLRGTDESRREDAFMSNPGAQSH